jgi:hypothetical protein
VLWPVMLPMAGLALTVVRACTPSPNTPRPPWPWHTSTSPCPSRNPNSHCTNPSLPLPGHNSPFNRPRPTHPFPPHSSALVTVPIDFPASMHLLLICAYL